MKTILFALLIVTTSAFAHGHLVFKKGALHAHTKWVSGPLVGGESVMKIDFKNGDHSPAVFTDKLDVVLWMPEMGHGSGPTTVAKTSDSSFQVNDIYFLMGGKWEVKFTITNQDGSKETQILKVDADGPGHNH